MGPGTSVAAGNGLRTEQVGGTESEAQVFAEWLPALCPSFLPLYPCIPQEDGSASVCHLL